MKRIEVSTNLEASGDLAKLGVKRVDDLIVGVWNWDQPINNGVFDSTNHLFSKAMIVQGTSLTLAGVDIEHSVRRIGWTQLQRLEITSSIQYSTLVKLIERLPELTKLMTVVQFDESQFDHVLERDIEKRRTSPVKKLRSRLQSLQITRANKSDRPAVVRVAVWLLLLQLPTLSKFATDMRRVLQLPRLVREYCGVKTPKVS
ncbi:hypothetical protein LPJ73_001059 [Coemansia sp. RSA 2703]|nr:hypothetical protein LPJ73_001059 [Coemansia sp. RSA 2703]